MLAALQWLKTNNKYYHSITIDHQAVAQLPEDGDVTGLHAVTVDTADEAEEDQPTQDGGDPYDSHLDRSVPIVATRRTEEENIRQSLQERQSQVPSTTPPGHLLEELPSMSSTQRATYPVPGC